MLQQRCLPALHVSGDVTQFHGGCVALWQRELLNKDSNEVGRRQEK